MPAKIVMTAEDIRRTLARIAHEIIERNKVTDHLILVGPMSDDELRRAIERPAQLVGLEFEGGLVDALIGDVEAEPGSLPLLAHALFELWDRRQGRRLTFAAYREIGGVQGAIAHRAESVFRRFDEAEQTAARRSPS